MDKALLTTLGLDPDKDLKALLEDLEGKQYEFFERLETTNDEKRKEELSGLLSSIDQAIGQIKDQLASVDSAIILDVGTPPADTEVQAKKEAKEKDKEKEAQLTAKVQALKEKEAQRQQEAQAAAQAAQDAAPAAPVAQQPSSDLQQGLLRYHKQNYTAAFPIFKQLAEQNDPTAQYMLACMYNRGEGTPADYGRAVFWMKKAADNGDKVAQFDYAIFQLTDPNHDKEKLAVSMQYLKRSADQGYEDAMVRYVDLVEQSRDTLPELKAARVYCDKLLQVTEDSYDKQKYSELRQQLRTRQKKLERRKFGAAVSSITSTAGALILIVPTLWMFASFHQDFLRTLPVISDFPAQVLDILFGYGYGSRFFVEAMVLVGIGWAIKGTGYKYTRNTLATVVVRTGCAIRYIAIIGHIGLCSYLGTDMLANAAYNLGGVAVMILGGRIIGWILAAIFGTRKL